MIYNTTEDSFNKYLQQMSLIRKRTDVITNITSKRFTTGFNYSDLEICVLQIRKIIELIGMGSIISNHEEYSKIHEKYYNNWNARLIFKDVERINPEFYPQPITIIKHENGPDEFAPIKNGYMTKEEAIKTYEKCSHFLHEDNPYKNPIDVSYYEQKVKIWASMIVRLLNIHLVKLIDGNMYYVVMKSEINGNPAGNLFVSDQY